MPDEDAILLPIKSTADLRAVDKAIAELQRLDGYLEIINKRRVVINLHVDGAGELRSTVAGIEHMVALLRSAGAGGIATGLKEGILTTREAAIAAETQIRKLKLEYESLQRKVGEGEAQLLARKTRGPGGVETMGEHTSLIQKQTDRLVQAYSRMDEMQKNIALLSQASGAGRVMQGTSYAGAAADDAARAAKAAEDSAKVVKAAADTKAEAEAKSAKATKESAAAEKAAAKVKADAAKEQAAAAEKQKANAAAAATISASQQRAGLLGTRVSTNAEGEVTSSAKYSAGMGGTVTEHSTGRTVEDMNKLAAFRVQELQKMEQIAGKRRTSPDLRIKLLREEAEAYGDLAKAMKAAGLEQTALYSQYQRRSHTLNARADMAEATDAARQRAEQKKISAQMDAEQEAARKRQEAAQKRDESAQERRRAAMQARWDRAGLKQREQQEAEQAERNERARMLWGNRDRARRFKAFGGTEEVTRTKEDDGGTTVTRVRTAEDGKRQQHIERFDKQGRQLGSTLQNMADAHHKAEKAAATLGDRFTANTAKVAIWTASVAVLYGAVGALKSGFENAFNLDRKLATLSTVFRGTREEARGLMQDTLALAAAEGRGADEAADAAIRWSRLGLSRQATAEAVRVTLMAANVADISAGEAAQHLAAIYQTTSGSVGELQGKLGMLNQMQNTLNVTTGDLLQGYGRVGPLAKQAGFTFAETASIIATTASSTARSGAEIGNSLKALIVSLSNPEVQAFLKGRFGIDVTDKSGELRSGPEMMRQLFVETRGMNREERGEMMVKIAGKQQASRITAMLDNYVDSQANAISAQQNLNSAQSENNRILETTVAHWERLKTTWATAFDALHQNVTKKPINYLLDSVTNIGYEFGKVGRNADKWTVDEDQEFKRVPWAKNTALYAQQSQANVEAGRDTGRLLDTLGFAAKGMTPEELQRAMIKAAPLVTQDAARQEHYISEAARLKKDGKFEELQKLFEEMAAGINMPALRKAAEKAAKLAADSASHLERYALAQETNPNGSDEDPAMLRGVAKLLREVGTATRAGAVAEDDDLDQGQGMRLSARDRFEELDRRRRLQFTGTPFYGQGVEGQAMQGEQNKMYELMSRARFLPGQRGVEGKDFLALIKERDQIDFAGAARRDLDSKTLRGVDLGLAAQGGATPELAARRRIGFMESQLGQPRQEGRDDHLQTIALANAALREQLSLQRGIADITAQITAERERQNIEASKALIMAGHEDQLRAALMAKYTKENGRMTKEQFMFLSPEAKRTAAQLNPGDVPDEMNGIGELNKRRAAGQGELERVTQLIADFGGVVAAANAALARPVQQETPALNPQFNLAFVPQWGAMLDIVQKSVQAQMEAVAQKMQSDYQAFLRSSIGPKQVAAPAL